MATSPTFFVALRDELRALLTPLIAAAEHPAGVRILLQSLGHTDAVGDRSELRDEITRLATLVNVLASLDADELDSFSGLGRVLDLSSEILSAVRGLDRLVSDPTLAGQTEDLGADLVEFLVTRYLRVEHPEFFRVGTLLTLITPAELAPAERMATSGSTVLRFARQRDRLHLDRIEALLNQPLPTLTAHYFPNGLVGVTDAHAAAQRVFPVLTLLANALGLSTVTDTLRVVPRPPANPAGPDEPLDHFSGRLPGEEDEPVGVPPLDPIDLTPLHRKSVPRFVFALPGLSPEGLPIPATFGVAILVSSAEHPGGAKGLVVSLIGQLNASQGRGGWTLTLAADGQVPGFVIGPGGVSQAPQDAALAAASARIALDRIGEAGAPAFVVGSVTGTRLEVGAATIATELRVDGDESSAAVLANARSGKFVLAPGDGDGFLASILPSDGVAVTFDLGAELSSRHGLRLKGGAGLEATLPVGVSLGPVSVPTMHLGVRADGSGVHGEVSIGVGVSVGPVHAIIDRVGLESTVTFPDDGGNLGVADLALSFKAPTGVGLLVDAPLVLGGGFLAFDHAKGEYSGVMQLEIADTVAVKAIGLLATRLPDGTKGYSLLVMIFAEDFAPIQLGYGFVLTGIGGLLAINRTFDEQALRAGVKNGTLDSLLFPADPIRNAPQILSNLARFFPIAQGHHLFGPSVQISWGTPALITAELAVVLEMGARLRLLIVGQIAAILPRPDQDLIRIKMDTVGVVDFDQRTAALDASLYDSRLLNRFVLSGDMAMRLSWASPPNFALAVGGLHPAFNPPAGFPKLERIAVSLSSGTNPRLRCEAYFALTANTVQFGARAELSASAAGFTIQGDTGFDVLIQIEPFAFLAQFHAQVQLKRGSRNLFKVRVDGALAGPRPLHIKGKATFEIFWMDVTVRFDKTLVEGERPPRPAPVAVLPLLRAALEDARNWTAPLPDAARPMVTLRPAAASSAALHLHPLGTLTVKQGIVPLDVEISRFGSVPPADATTFAITHVTVGARSQKPQPVREFFPPAQFFEMTDGEKLSRPSFESLPAGVTIGSSAVTFSDDRSELIEIEKLEFETIIMDKARGETRPANPAGGLFHLDASLLARQALFGAAGSSRLRRAGTAKYRADGPRYAVVKEGWSLVSIEDLSVIPAPDRESAGPAAYSEAVERLRALRRENPRAARRAKILRLSELASR